MKILHIACLAGLLWLTGCATTGSVPDQAAAGGSTTSTKAPIAPHTPVIPNGPLKPITAAQAAMEGRITNAGRPPAKRSNIFRGLLRDARAGGKIGISSHVWNDGKVQVFCNADRAAGAKAHGDGFGLRGEPGHGEVDAARVESAGAEVDALGLEAPAGLGGDDALGEPRLHGGDAENGDKGDQRRAAGERGPEEDAEPATKR